MFLGGDHRHRHGVGQHDAGRVGDITRFVIDHLVAGVEQRAQRDVDGFGNADGDEHLACGIIGHAEESIDVAGDGFAQREQAEIGGVGRLAFFQRVNGGLADVPWRDEVRFADAERDHVVAALHEFEEVADARARDRGDVAGDFRGIVHGWAATRRARNLTRRNGPRQCRA